MDIAERALRTRITEIDRMIADLKRQREAVKSDLYELRQGEPILQGPCIIVDPITGEEREIKAI